ncbi:helix-turn-helix transcriptional regulator [Sanguibacter sp. HDW7]|uniref:helix-turn-helix domain-containing protein n=1 Tax=Sanguibacter sp. HDW7 TaxID=2714931 RepID=UPI00140756A4|nr:helix-turn-helix transcriptional regulator [Sanguibacter sp. HDW7]
MGWHHESMSTSTHLAPGLVPFWTFGDRLRKARLTAGYDQREFAERIGATPSRIAHWETDRSLPRNQVAVARRIELLTGIPATWILGLDAERPRPDGPDGGEECAIRDSNPEPAD